MGIPAGVMELLQETRYLAPPSPLENAAIQNDIETIVRVREYVYHHINAPEHKDVICATTYTALCYLREECSKKGFIIWDREYSNFLSTYTKILSHYASGNKTILKIDLFELFLDALAKRFLLTSPVDSYRILYINRTLSKSLREKEKTSGIPPLNRTREENNLESFWLARIFGYLHEMGHHVIADNGSRDLINQIDEWIESAAREAAETYNMTAKIMPHTERFLNKTNYDLYRDLLDKGATFPLKTFSEHASGMLSNPRLKNEIRCDFFAIYWLARFLIDAVGDDPGENERLALRLYWASDYFTRLGSLLEMTYKHIANTAGEPTGKSDSQGETIIALTSEMHSVRSEIRDAFIPTAVIKVLMDAGLPLIVMLPDENEKLQFYNKLLDLFEHITTFLQHKNALYDILPKAIDMNKFTVWLDELGWGNVLPKE